MGSETVVADQQRAWRPTVLQWVLPIWALWSIKDHKEYLRKLALPDGDRLPDTALLKDCIHNVSNRPGYSLLSNG